MQCAAGSEFRVTIHESDLDIMAGLVMRYPRRETGGNLFGFWTHSGYPTIQLALGPGPRARHEALAFYQDSSFMASQGARVQAAFGLQHIGDWHSHHALGLAEPSRGDVQTILRTLNTHGFPRFMALIATIRPARAEGPDRPVAHRPSDLVQINAFLFEAGSETARRGAWVILPGSSPIADAARERGVTDPTDPVRPAHWTVDLAPLRTVATARIAGWYTQLWGTEFIRVLDARCRQTFENCRIVAGTDPGELFYTFDYGGSVATIAFPPGFPAGAPMIMLAGRTMPIDDCRSHLSHVDLVQLLVAAVIGQPAAMTATHLTGSAEGVRGGVERAAAEEA